MSAFSLDPSILEIVLGAKSTIDLPKLSVHSREEAIQFIFTYGYDISDYKDSKVLWKTHRLAVEILEEEILDVGEELPAKVRNKEELEDITDLLILASYADGSQMQKYACAILIVMHMIIHLENDLFTSFTDDIQYQILRPIQEHIVIGEKNKTYLGNNHEIRLVDFSIKPFKQTKSGVIKLLARDKTVAMTLLDRVGMRFITRSVYDIFRVIKYLVDHHLISPAQTIVGQSKNLICPVDVFIEAQESFIEGASEKENFEKFNQVLNSKIKDWSDRGNELETKNEFTSKDFKFIKFISRRFLKIDRGADKEPLKFFYPFEVQILDNQTFMENENSEASHKSYKERQRRVARHRLLGF
jgi:uncharacterized protein (TIGR04562 family)